MKRPLLLVIALLPAASFGQYTTGGVAYASSSSTLTSTAAPTSGQLLEGTGSGPIWTSSLSQLYVNGPVGILSSPASNVGLQIEGTFSGLNNFGLLNAPAFYYTANSQYDYSTRSQAGLDTGTYTGLTYYNLHLATPYSVTGSKYGTSAQLYMDQGAGFTNSWGIYQAGTDPNYFSGDVLVNGYVGIGTNDPTYPLCVNGTIEAKEIIVQTGWSDYVFDKNYRLEPLAEVEAYIQSEQHLPGVPSARQVKETGVSLGEMQSKLLAQIEQLTLHVIQQGKAIKDQAKRLDDQSAELRIQAAEMDALKRSNIAFRSAPQSMR